MTFQPQDLYKPLIWCEGIIGAGKTKLSKEVGKRLGLRIIEEPVDSNPYLTPFYSNPPDSFKQFAFGMQMWLLHQRYAMQRLAADEATGVGGFKGAILDRSISGDRVFAKMHMREGNIHPLDWETYERAYNHMARCLLPPTLLVYLDAKPETAHQRMLQRDRAAERQVPLEYLVSLREGYRDLLQEAEAGLLPWAHAVRTVRIPWDVDTATEDQWDHTAETIKDACRIMYQQI